MGNAKGNNRSYYWYVPIAIVLIIGVLAAIYVGMATVRNVRASLLERTQSIAELVPTSTITSLDASEKDLESEKYNELKNNLLSVREANRDIRFIYIFAQNNNDEVFFHIDSESPESEDYSPPGQLYPEDEGEVAEVYENKQSIVLPVTSDRWGTWLSAYSPITEDDGTVVGVLGVDVPANDYYWRIATNASIPLLLAAIVIIILLWTKRRSQYEQRYLTDKAFFLSFASHEIRSPLTSIAWALQPLLNSLPEKSSERRAIGKIHTSMKHILGTVDDVLSLQATEGLRGKKLEKEPVHIDELINTLIESLKLFSEEHATKIINKTSGVNKHLVVNIDTLLFKRVVSNFLVNSVKYSPRNTTVSVDVTQSRHHWTVSIHNEGVGLSKEEQAKIMKGFYRTKAAGASGQKGTGLGVMLSSDIINRHGGQLELESHPNKGVTFKIILPL